MSPIQQMLLGAGSAVASKKWIDDCFSTFLYIGTGTESGSTGQTITNGIDLAGEGGMTWIKSRSWGSRHAVLDTVRGAGKMLSASEPGGQTAADLSGLASFTSNGFTLGNESVGYQRCNMEGKTYASWTFRKSPGFFDVVTYTGNGTAGRTISHSLGSVPGMIIIKNLDSAEDWRVYHRSLGGTHNLVLNSTAASAATSSVFNQTDPTASVFTVGTSDATNQNGDDFVAYVFAGGESTAATARSVDFDGSGDYLEAGGGTDMQLGTGDFTIETFAYFDSVAEGNMIYEGRPNGVQGAYISIYFTSAGTLGFYTNSASRITASNITVGQWYHIALVRNSSVTRLYVNGVDKGSYSDTSDYTVRTDGPVIGIARNLSNNPLNGKLSNYRIVKGTAVYTSSFKPPTEPLTNITNTKLLCCNNSSTTGSTVTPGTITAGGNPTASTDSPFDDPAGFAFGDAGDQNVIKCGSYVGGTAGQEINVGFEPQWLLIKSASNTRSWQLVDCMRGFTAKGLNDEFLSPDSSGAESDDNRVWPTPTGFGLDSTDSAYNYSGSTYVYIAIRRPDGYVGKPPELGSGCFQMDTGNTQTTIPNYDSGFPVDFALLKNPGTATSWDVTARLTGTKYIKTDVNTAEANYNDYTFDSNTGWAKDNGPGTMQSWMWKRHAGFTVCTWVGDGTNRIIPHDLSKAPEMIWIKNRGSTNYWIVGHKGLNGGTNPWEKYLRLSTNDSELDDDMFQDLAPTSTHFAIKANDHTNENTQPFIAMLFASVDGISKVGYYDGNNSSRTITIGFQPRFLIIKGRTLADDWFVWDTTRGWGSGVDPYLRLNLTNAEGDDHDWGAPTSTGFTLSDGNQAVNSISHKYIYYAHA